MTDKESFNELAKKVLAVKDSLKEDYSLLKNLPGFTPVFLEVEWCSNSIKLAFQFRKTATEYGFKATDLIRCLRRVEKWAASPSERVTV